MLLYCGRSLRLKKKNIVVLRAGDFLYGGRIEFYSIGDEGI